MFIHMRLDFLVETISNTSKQCLVEMLQKIVNPLEEHQNLNMELVGFKERVEEISINKYDLIQP